MNVLGVFCFGDVCRNLIAAVVTVLSTGKSECHAVKMENIESFEIVLMRDTKIFVFANKGFASLPDSLMLIFQVLNTNLLRK